MAWVRVPPENHSLFHAALPKDAGVETVPMFGGVGAKVNGHMFAGLFGRSVMVLLTESDRAAALKLAGAAPFDPMGNRRVRSEKVMLPESVMHDPAKLRRWIARAFKAAVSLPARASKMRARKASNPGKTPAGSGVPAKLEETPARAFARVVEALMKGGARIEPPTESRRAFGSNGIKVNGKIFAMLVRGSLVLKLPRSRVEAMIAAGIGTAFDAGKGKPMKEWVVVRAPDATWISLAREARAFVEGSRKG